MMKQLMRLSALGMLAVPFAAARADLVFDGLATISGTGLGSVNTTLTISSQANSTTEQGCVGFTSGGDVIGNFATATQSGCTSATNGDVLTGASQTHTHTLSELSITSGSDFAILFNAAEPSGNSITLDGLVATFYNNSGNVIMTAVFTGAPFDFAETLQGTGKTGELFTLSAAEQTELGTLIGSLGAANIHVGLGASAGDPLAATGGNETFFVFKSGLATVVPEPSTVVLTASGMLGLAGFVRRRRRT